MTLKTTNASDLVPCFFTPTDESGIVGWYKPSQKCWTDAGKTTQAGDTDSVYTLEDSSGNGNDLIQATAIDRPTLDSVNAAYANESTLAFAGSQTLQSAAFTAVSQPITIFMVCDLSVVTPGASNIFDGIGASNRMVLYPTTGPVWSLFSGTGDSDGDTADTSAHYHTCLFDGTGSKLWLDGVQAAADTTDVGNDTLTGFTIGSNYQKGSPITGDIAEVIIYEGDKTGGSIQTDIERYLRNKFNL